MVDLVTRARSSLIESSRAHPGGAANRWGVLLLVVLIFVYVEFATGGFVTVSNVTAILVNIASTLIAGAAAMRLLVTGNVDLSIGGQLSLLGVVVAIVARDTGDVVLPVAVAIVGGTAIGLINGLVVRWLSINPIIVTLGLSFIYAGAAYALSGSKSVFGFGDAFTRLGTDRLLGLPIPVWVALVFFVIAGFVLTRTPSGVRRYAIGGNAESARNAGIKVDRALLFDFAFMGFAMGLVALLMTSRVGSGTPDMGLNFEIEVLAAIIVGGVGFAGGSGRPLGVFFGILLLGSLSSAMIFLGVPDYWQRVAKGVILLLALAADQYAQYRKRKAVSDLGSAPSEKAEEVRAGDGQTAAIRRPTLEQFDAAAGDSPRTVATLEGRALRVEHVTKHYGPVKAVNDVSFTLEHGQVTCLLGDNGAGKSSLIKTITGAISLSSGSITVGPGDGTHVSDVAGARALGIETVWQDLAVCTNLGAAYNLALGDEPTKRLLGVIRVFDRRAARRTATARLKALGVQLDDMWRPLASLSGGQRQSVAIGRVVSNNARIVILDEPTAALGVTQTRNVLRLIEKLADEGVAVLLVTHDVEIVKAVADHILVLNRGRLVCDESAKTVGTARLVHLMAGIEFDPQKEAQQSPA